MGTTCLDNESYCLLFFLAQHELIVVVVGGGANGGQLRDVSFCEVGEELGLKLDLQLVLAF